MSPGRILSWGWHGCGDGCFHQGHEALLLLWVPGGKVCMGPLHGPAVSNAPSRMPVRQLPQQRQVGGEGPLSLLGVSGGCMALDAGRPTRRGAAALHCGITHNCCHALLQVEACPRDSGQPTAGVGKLAVHGGWMAVASPQPRSTLLTHTCLNILSVLLQNVGHRSCTWAVLGVVVVPCLRPHRQAALAACTSAFHSANAGGHRQRFCRWLL